MVARRLGVGRGFLDLKLWILGLCVQIVGLCVVIGDLGLWVWAFRVGMLIFHFLDFGFWISNVGAGICWCPCWFSECDLGILDSDVWARCFPSQVWTLIVWSSAAKERASRGLKVRWLKGRHSSREGKRRTGNNAENAIIICIRFRVQHSSHENKWKRETVMTRTSDSPRSSRYSMTCIYVYIYICICVSCKYSINAKQSLGHWLGSNTRIDKPSS